MQIEIIAVGTIKEKYLQEAKDDYIKRISRFCKVKEINVKHENNNNLSKEEVLEREAKKIEDKIKDRTFLIVMDIDGAQMSSEKLSQKIESLKVEGVSHITFIIGGSYGIHQRIKNKAKIRLSFSKMTFPHQLFKVLLLEQIYRSFKIATKQNYHK